MTENRRYVLLALLFSAAMVGIGLVGLFESVYILVADSSIIPAMPGMGQRVKVSDFFGYFTAFLAALVIFKKQDYVEWLEDVIKELRIVHWPNKEELRMSTIVVLILVFFMAFVFWLYDFIWSSLTAQIYL